MGRVDGKIATVTGGARGLGRSACELLAAEGARVAVTDLHDDEGREVAASIRDAGGDADYWTLDVTDEDRVRQVLGEVVERWGRIDVLVNNAGIAGTNKPTHELSREEWDRVIQVNVTGTFLCTKHAVPVMREHGGGSIIDLSSIYGIVGAPDAPPYHASKGAVRLMAKTDALLYAGDGIRVNSIHPGFIWTPMVAEDYRKQLGVSEEELRRKLAEAHPIGHAGDPEDIGWGVVYLASDEAKFITGSELVIDGGYTAR